MYTFKVLLQKCFIWLFRCKESFHGPKIGGGKLMEATVNAVFSALIWHTQELREIVAAFGM